MGDLYAGLYPSAKVMHNPALARRQSVVFGDIQDKLSDKMKIMVKTGTKALTNDEKSKFSKPN